MEDELQSHCSQIGLRNTLWRPTKMSSTTAQGPARESKESKPHRASPPGSRRLIARTGRGGADPGDQAERRSAGNWVGRPRRAAAATGHSGERQATQRQAPSGRGATVTGPEPARGTRHPARRPALRQRQGWRQSPRGKPACVAASGPAPRSPAAGAVPGNWYDSVSIFNFFDSVDL